MIRSMSCGGAAVIRALVLSAVVAGCGGQPLANAPAASELAAARSALVIDNGRQLNGRQLNGRQLNGRQLNGRQLNGRQLNGRQLNGPELNLRQVSFGGSVGGGTGTLVAVWLDGSAIVGVDDQGAELRGEQLVGAELVEASAAGPDQRLRIDAVSVDAVHPDSFRYTVSDLQGGTWRPLCGVDDGGQAIEAVALSGTWDPSTGSESGGDHIDDPQKITFACSGYVLSKCVDLGYKPWVPGGRALHQGCTRALRADYCGDGRSFTTDGELINIYDGAGIQVDSEPWTLEAEWTAEGARCVSLARRSQAPSFPQCARSLDAANCGDLQNFGSGTLLMTEFEAR